MERTLLHHATIIHPKEKFLQADGLLVLEHKDAENAPDYIGYSGLRHVPVGQMPDASLHDDTWLSCDGGYMLPGLCDLDAGLLSLPSPEDGISDAQLALVAYRRCAALLYRGLTSIGLPLSSSVSSALRQMSDDYLLWAPRLVDASTLVIPDGWVLFDGLPSSDSEKDLWISRARQAKSDGRTPCVASRCAMTKENIPGIIKAALLLIEAGYTNMEALQAISYNNAFILGLSDSVGSLSKNFEGDLILTSDNPLLSLKTLASPRLTARGGRLIQCHLSEMERTRLAVLPPGYSL